MNEFNLLTPPLLKDQRYGKNWERSDYSNETVTVSEFTSQAIQQAIDSLPNGGNVCLTEGTYVISASIRLHDGITLQGVPGKTVLYKKDGFHSSMKVDVDYGELVATPDDASGFSVGDAITIKDDVFGQGWYVTHSYIKEIHDGCLFFDDYTHYDYSRERNGIISNACSVISCIECQDVTIKDLQVEGNRSTNDYIPGCRAGGVYAHRVRNIVMDHVNVHDFNGEGISIQTTTDCVIRSCTISHCAGNGIHPGTGSHYLLVENCESFDNDKDGLFICWRVIKGIFRNNRFHHNHNSGINIGHKDTDNLFTGNELYENDFWGIHFREETFGNSPHRCVLRNNVFRGNKRNIARFESEAKEILFEDNDFSLKEGADPRDFFEIVSDAEVTIR